MKLYPVLLGENKYVLSLIIYSGYFVHMKSEEMFLLIP